MKTDIKKICKWLYEILEEDTETFADFFKYDICEFLDIKDLITIESKKMLRQDLKNLCGDKFKKLEDCLCKKDVRKWVNNITSYIIRKNEVENIISDYLGV